MFVDAYNSIAHNIVGYIVFAKSYLGHVRKKGENHWFTLTIMVNSFYVMSVHIKYAAANSSTRQNVIMCTISAFFVTYALNEFETVMKQTSKKVFPT